MNRFLRSVIILFYVASCGSSEYSAPRDLENACSIVRERPHYLAAMNASERRWGIPVHVQMAAIYQESKFIGNARTPHQYALGVIPMGRQSSAYGYSQALDNTWDEYRSTTGNRNAKRDDINDATDFMGWYMSQAVARLSVAPQDAENLYLAYHEGFTGYVRQSYKSKDWLVRIANEVGVRSQNYALQLAACN
ncbi:MAG: lytic transglycosylase [Deltaproteobacteria bacterium]